jgi:hypothetical protein
MCLGFNNKAQTFNSSYNNLRETLDTTNFQDALDQNENNSNDTIKNKYGIGLSGFEFYSEKTGLVVGINGKIKYSFDGINSVTSIIRVGAGFNGYGAVEPVSNDDELFKSFYEISIFYCRSLNEVLSGLYIGGGMGIINGQKENNSRYFSLCIPLTIGTKIKLTEWLNIDLGINSQINNNTILLGFDIGLLFEF